MILFDVYFLLDVMMILATITLTFSLNNVILLINFLSMITIVGIELSISNIEITLLILVIYESSLLCLFLVNGVLLMSSSLFRFHSLSLISCIDPIIDNSLNISFFNKFNFGGNEFRIRIKKLNKHYDNFCINSSINYYSDRKIGKVTILYSSFSFQLIITSYFNSFDCLSLSCFSNYFASFFLFLVYLFQSINYLDSNSSLFLYFPFSLSLSLFINIGFNRVGNLIFDNSLFLLIVLIFYVSIVSILSLYNRSSFWVSY